MSEMKKILLSIGGSDSIAGAGIQADLKTGMALNCYVATVVTAITAQNTLGVQAVEAVSADMVAKQILSISSDCDIGVIKISMLPNLEIAKTVIESLPKNIPIIFDPVMISSSGQQLIDLNILNSIKNNLLPKIKLLTPNILESAFLLNCSEENIILDRKQACEKFLRLGMESVLLKGGHLPGDSCDDIFFDGFKFFNFSSPKIKSINTHGTGCTLSTAIAAYYLKTNCLQTAIKHAKYYVSTAISNAIEMKIGQGAGALSH